MNIEEYKNRPGTLSYRTKVVPVVRGSYAKVFFEESINTWRGLSPDKALQITHRTNVSVPMYDGHVLRDNNKRIIPEHRIDKELGATQTFANVIFDTIGNDWVDRWPDASFYELAQKWSTTYFKSKAQALGAIKRAMQSQDYKDDEMFVVTSQFSPDLVYPPTAGPSLRGKPSASAGLWFNKVSYFEIYP